MSSKLSVEEVLANLEQRATFHRNQEVLHAQQEVHHQEQRELHASELAKVQQSLEAFRAAVPSAMELAVPVSTRSAPDVPQVELPPKGRLMVSRLLRQIALSPTLAEPFGPSSLAAAANRGFSGRLPRPVGQRAASDVLRRMLADREIELARDGKAFHEAQYVRTRRKE
jgi:hypothetical protein